MAPVKFGDISKEARDVLTRDFPIGEVKLEVSSKTAQGIELKTSGNIASKAGVLAGTFESKYHHAPSKATFTEKWSTRNVLTQVVELKDIAKGLTAEGEMVYAPNTGDLSGKLTLDYIHDSLRVLAVGDLNGKTQLSSVYDSPCGLVVGVDGGYDVKASTFTQPKCSLGYKNGELTATVLSNGTEFTTYVYHKANAKVQTGVQCDFSRAKGDTSLSFGAHYQIDSTSYFK
eukprot:Ihof_evm8s55 gene=Ihof_evmTU8s55